MAEPADSIERIRRFADTEEAMTPERRVIVQSRVNELYANRRLPNDLTAAIAQATLDLADAVAVYDARVIVRTTAETNRDAAQTTLTNLQDDLADLRIVLEDLQDDPPPVGESDELDATRYVALQEGVTIRHP